MNVGWIPLRICGEVGQILMQINNIYELDRDVRIKRHNEENAQLFESGILLLQQVLDTISVIGDSAQRPEGVRLRPLAGRLSERGPERPQRRL